MAAKPASRGAAKAYAAWTITERLMAAVMLPLAVACAVSYVTGPLATTFGETTAEYVGVAAWLIAFIGAAAGALALARSLARPLAEVADTLDALACAELESPPPLPANRGELGHLTAAADRFAEVVGERQRCELVHSDLDRTWQASRRVNLSNLSQEVEAMTEIEVQSISDGAATLQRKAEDMTAALETVRAFFDETARAATGSRAMTEAACRLSDQATDAVVEISEQMRRGSDLGREAVQRASASRAAIAALTKAADQIGEIVTVINSARARRHHRSSARRQREFRDQRGRHQHGGCKFRRPHHRDRGFGAALDVAAIVAAMQSASQVLCRNIPEIVRKAVKADLREFPRYAVTFGARLDSNGRAFEVSVHDVSLGGACIGSVDRLKVGDQIALTFAGMKAIAGEIVCDGETCGVCFKPARLRPEELRDLVTAPGKAT